MPITPSVTTRTHEKQTNILHAAAEMFLERGFDAVSLDDILSRTGGSKTTLYSYYGGKEGLFAAIVRKKCEDKLAPMRELDVSQMDPMVACTSLVSSAVVRTGLAMQRTIRGWMDVLPAPSNS